MSAKGVLLWVLEPLGWQQLFMTSAPACLCCAAHGLSVQHVGSAAPLPLCVVCREQMAEAGVNGVVTADVLLELSNDTVLTTAWVDGEQGWYDGHAAAPSQGPGKGLGNSIGCQLVEPSCVCLLIGKSPCA